MIRRSKRVLPGFTLSLGLSVLFISLVMLLPLCTLLLQTAQLSWSEFWFAVTDPRVVAAYKVTLLTAACAALLNGIFGLLLAWILVRYQFPGRTLIDALVDLPFALPTAVAGLTLSALFATNGWIGSLFDQFGIKISYTQVGIVLAMMFTSIPFVVRTVQPVLEDLGPEYEEAAETLGASPSQSFRRVVFPHILLPLSTGVALSFIRSLGEFGAVIFIAGNMPFKTEVASLMIFTRIQEYEHLAAAAIATVILGASLILLFVVQILQARFLKRLGVA